MTKHSRHEREKRVVESERTRQVEAAWFNALPAETVREFTREVEAARARGPLPPPPDMAPGTLPRPPRPGREPKVVKEERRPRRGQN
jgi:hypothetical protein